MAAGQDAFRRLGRRAEEDVDRRRALAQYLESHHVMTVATNGGDGPWAAAVFYVNSDLDFYFVSSPATRHALHIAGSPAVAATIQDDCASWPDIQGVQMSATVAPIDGAERTEARRLYARKFPGILDGAGVPAAIATALQRSGWYRLRAGAIRFIDNSVGFGHRDEWQRPGASA